MISKTTTSNGLFNVFGEVVIYFEFGDNNCSCCRIICDYEKGWEEYFCWFVWYLLLICNIQYNTFFAPNFWISGLCYPKLQIILKGISYSDRNRFLSNTFILKKSFYKVKILLTSLCFITGRKNNFTWEWLWTWLFYWQCWFFFKVGLLKVSFVTLKSIRNSFILYCHQLHLNDFSTWILKNPLWAFGN